MLSDKSSLLLNSTANKRGLFGLFKLASNSRPTTDLESGTLFLEAEDCPVAHDPDNDCSQPAYSHDTNDFSSGL
jgi:hypothetical protein